MRKLGLAVVLLLGVFFIIAQLSEVQALAEIFSAGDWRFLLIGPVLLILWFVNIAYSYKSIFSAVGVDESLKKLIVLSSAAFFLNVVAPAAGASGMAVFISEARKHGYSSGRVTAAGVLYILFDYAAILCLVAVGFVVLLRRNNLTFTEITAAVLLLIIASGLASLTYLGMRSARSLGQALAWLARIANRLTRPFTHKASFSETRAFDFAIEASDGLVKMRNRPKSLVLPLLLALSSKCLLVAIFLCTFLAFNVPFSPGTIIAGFSIGYLFLVISPIPSGIGVVEGILTLTLRSLWVPLEAAAVIALAYRGLTLWLPLFIGMISFRMLVRSGEVDEIPLDEQKVQAAQPVKLEK